MARKANHLVIRELSVRFAPNLIAIDETIDRVVVMADILRASTTIINALANGASVIYPRAEIEESRQLARELGPTAILGGERCGEIIDGFDLGNSPNDYHRDRVAGRSLVLCTTNGTYTLEYCRKALQVFIGAFVNLSTVCNHLDRHDKVLIACAGTDRRVSDEDVLFAGAVVEKLASSNHAIVLDDSARIAASRWQVAKQSIEKGEKRLCELLAECHGGVNLTNLGYHDDVKFCAQIDSLDNVPELDLASWSIRGGPTSNKSGVS